MQITSSGDHWPTGDSRGVRGRVRWQFTEPAILLLLRDGPSHGYQLLGRLRSLAPSTAAAPDTSVVYRLLRGLEAEGFLRSSWADNPGAGPARHVYELTDSGRNKLDGWLSAIAEEIQAMSRLLATYYSR